MYDYDRTTGHEAYDYQRVVSSLTQDIVKQAFKLVSTALKLAGQAVHGLKFNAELPAHEEVEQIERPLLSLARWMSSRREAEAQAVAHFAELTSELSKLTKFWNRPLFLNKSDHAEKVEALYKQMQKVKTEVVKAFRMSGAWQPAAPAF